MMRRIVATITLLAANGCTMSEAREPEFSRTRAALDLYIEDLGRLGESVDSLEAAAERLSPDPASALVVRDAFRDSRLRYKRVEALAEYYNPDTVESLNGPAIPEIAEDDPTQTVIDATGFQVVEEMIFPSADAGVRDDLVREIGHLRTGVLRLANAAAGTELTDSHLFDALRLQLARILSLGISGFDSPVAEHSVIETAAALNGIRSYYAIYASDLADRDPELASRLELLFERADKQLAVPADFAAFDRLAFIVESLNPLMSGLLKAELALDVHPIDEVRAWRTDAPTMFSQGAFDTYYFAPAGSRPATAQEVELGRHLFFETALSGDGSRSCATCHRPELGFSDGLPRSAALPGSAAELRNAPGLINAGLQMGSFYDLRTTFIEDQVTSVIHNPDEMRGDLAVAVGRLREHAAYATALAADADSSPDVLSEGWIRAALAGYIRSLEGLNSRFDEYVRGDRDALSAEEQLGANLFMGKAKCGTCHFAPLFNGTVPPMYRETDVEVLGVPARADTLDAQVDADLGRFELYRNELHRHAFRTPTVRNIALTAPYMHNGVYRTLEEVVDFYDRGGGAGIGIELENQTLPGDRLELTPEEKSALVAFMEALTDTTAMRDARIMAGRQASR